MHNFTNKIKFHNLFLRTAKTIVKKYLNLCKFHVFYPKNFSSNMIFAGNIDCAIILWDVLCFMHKKDYNSRLKFFICDIWELPCLTVVR